MSESTNPWDSEESWKQWEEERSQPEARIRKALAVASAHSQVLGHRQKAWVIDQMVRALTGCPGVIDSAPDYEGNKFSFGRFDNSAEYDEFVKNHNEKAEESEPHRWDLGIMP